MTEPRKYRYRDLKPGDAYYDYWHVLHRRRMTVRGLVVLLAGMLVTEIVIDLASIWLAVAMYLVLAAVILCVQRMARMVCPRCGEIPRAKGGRTFLATGEYCGACDLNEYAPDDPDKEPRDD